MLRSTLRTGIGLLKRSCFPALLLAGGMAHAASLPVTGVYGSGSGCRLYEQYGMAAIVSAGGTLNLPEEASETDSVILTANEVVGDDWTCQPSTVDGENAALNCLSDGATWMPMPVATIKPSADSILFTLVDEADVTLDVTLKKCG